MSRARATLVSVEDTPYYHCVGRCVRRAFLCGNDEKTGRSYEHRRAWMSERLHVLTEVFAIDICAYALMSNHYHLVLKLDPQRTESWSHMEVIQRWTVLYRGSDAAQRYLLGEPLEPAEQAGLAADVEIWRSRLSDLSWFMRCLNEHIARRANVEDGCTGHFWESRFKSQALLDDAALLTAMAYVDLNPVRANRAGSIPRSDYTSAQDRYRDITNEPHTLSDEQRPSLMSFADSQLDSSAPSLPFRERDYLDLVDCTGRIVVSGKPGFIEESTPTLLTSLGLNPREWLQRVTRSNDRLELAIGEPVLLHRFAARSGKQWIQGAKDLTKLYRAIAV